MLETLGAFIVRLTPNTPPALWMPYAGYAATAFGALLLAAGTLAATRSRVAACATAIAFVATAAHPIDSPSVLVCALALLGLSTLLSGVVPRWVVPTLLFAGIPFSSQGGLIVWLLAGMGMAAVGDRFSAPRAPRTRPLRLAAITLLTLVIVTARLPAATTSAPPAPRPMGHDRLTLKTMRALVSNIPSGSALVTDDLVTGILFRAMFGDLERAHVQITAIDQDGPAIRQRVQGQRVFAWPLAQQALQRQGLQIVDSLHTANRGLAEVVSGAECVTAMSDWRTAASLTERLDLAFVADNEDHRGPVVIYLLGKEPIHIGAPNWPARTLRGFSPRTFDLTRAQDRQDLERQRTEDLGPWTLDLTNATSVTRVALWRMPDSALQMPITLSAPATFAAVKLAPEAKRAVSVCPVFPAAVSPIR